MNKADLSCIPGCSTDHASELDLDHCCSTFLGSAVTAGPARPVELLVSASRCADEDDTNSFVAVGLFGLDEGDECLDLDPAGARRLAGMLLAAADALDPVRVAPKRARRPVCTARAARPVAAAQGGVR